MTEIPPPPPPPPSSSGSYTPPPPPPPPADGSAPPPPPGSPTPGTSPDASDRSIMLLLSYAGPLALVPLIQKKDDADLQWHAKNGLALGVAWLIVTIIISLLFSWYWEWKLRNIATLIYVVVDIIALAKAFGNQRFKIPVVTDFAEKF
jgi:uncharacterized membrane protein